MDSRFLNVLHNAADVKLSAVVNRINVDFDRVIQEPVDQQRRCSRDDDKVAHAIEIISEGFGVVHNLHTATAENVRRTDQDRVTDVLRNHDCFGLVRRGAVLGREQPGVVENGGEKPALLGEIDCFGSRAENRNTGVLQTLSKTERRLTPELHDDTHKLTTRAFGVDDLQDVFEREGLEVEAIARVVVS